MRKFLISIIGIFCSINLFAENQIQIVPFSTSAGVVSDDGESMTFNFTNENFKVNAIKFYLYLPSGLKLDTSYDGIDGAEYTAVVDGKLDDARVTYKSGRNTLNTGHSAAYNYLGEENGYNKYVFLISQGTNSKELQGTSGRLFSVYYVTSSDMAEGTYPIYVKKVELTNLDEVMIPIESSVSFVTIGNPATTSLDLDGDVPSFVTSAIPANATVDLSKTTAIFGDNSNNLNVKYSRTVSNEWNTICLPFEAQSTEAVKFYSIDNVGDDYVEVTYKQSLNACEPALVKVAGEELTVEGTGVNTSALSPGTMVGTFEPIKVTDAGSYYIKGNKFYSINEYFNVGAFKAYYQYVPSAKGDVLDIVENTTDINAVSADLNGIEEIYGVNGTRQQNLQNGLNIVKIGDKVMKVLVK